MIYAHMSEDARQALETALKAPTNVTWYRRLKSIDLSSQGYTVPQLAKLFDLCQATVRDYLRRYHQGGIDALKRHASDGPPPKVPQDKAFWEELLRRSPSQFEKLPTAARNWTQHLLVEYCRHYLGVPITQAGLSLLLKRLGIRWNRSKLKVSAPAPLYTVKRERVETLKKSPRRAVDPSRGHRSGEELASETRPPGVSRFDGLTLVSRCRPGLCSPRGAETGRLSRDGASVVGALWELVLSPRRRGLYPPRAPTASGPPSASGDSAAV